MAEAFRGEFTQKVDAKARVSIPAAFRRVLESGDPDSSRPRIVMVYGDERRKFVECYTVAEAQRLEARIRRLPIGSPQRRVLERNMITLSATIDIDDDGRIVLPPKVREKIALGADELAKNAEAIFAGTLDAFQIWRKDTYEGELEAEAALMDLPEGVDILSLLGDDPAEG